METTTKTKQQSVLRLLAALFFLCLFAPMAAGQDNWKDHCATQIANKDGGDGSSWDNAIEIATAKELAYFAQQLNNNASISYGSGNSIGPDDKGQARGFISYYFALAADIDLSDYDWTPIGNATNPFNGNFDGRGHCVNGLKVETVSGSAYAGLFGCTSVGILRNLGVRLADAGIQANSADGSAYVGGIAGYAHNIFNCYVVGEGAIGVSSSEMGDYIYAGGIVGSLGTNSSLANCYATVNVKVESDGRVYVGGIVGFGNFNSTISHTYATGDVETGTVDYRRYAGGICGYLQTEGTLTNSLAVNGRIIGGDSYSNRIIGHQESKATLDANYASPEIQVNGSVVILGAGDDVNGNPSVNLGNFGSVLTWGNGWDTRDDTHLPQLKRQTGDDPNYSYIAWPTGEGYTPQSPPVASDYLIAVKFASGTGFANDPYLITNRAELAYLAKQVNSGEDYNDKNFALTADIDLSAYYWTPIGSDTNPFNGNFDGRGHCVSGLKVETVSWTAYAGLFGCTPVGILRNLGVRLADEGIQANSTGGSAYAGGIAGYAHNIFNCYVVGEGTIEASFSREGNNIYAGGIVGYLDDNGSLTNCYATVNVKVEPKGLVYVGGIVGYGSYNSTISFTYATGDVETGTGAKFYYAGGICRYLRNEGTLTNSLAANGRITGGNSFSNRIVGNKESNSTLTGNYASPEIQVNGSFVSNGAKDNENGDPDVDLDNFGSVLTWGDGWDTSDDTHLPQLKMQTGDDPNYSYIDWPTGPGYTPQPSLDAAPYFPSEHTLHIVSPTGGTLKVTDKDGIELSDGSKIVSGTLLTLSYTESPNYRFSEYLSGSSADNLRTLSGNTIQISDADLYLSARFNYEDPTPPPPPAPIYYSVFLPSVEGAVTDPVAGTYDVESWSTFRFYLTLDADYDESQPVVTTSRGETLQPRTSDGAYLLKNVCTDVEVFIDGIEKNPPPVANEPIRAESPEPEIWSEDACLCIRLPEGMPTSPVRIFTPEGRLLDSFGSTPGLNRRQLPTGIYIVQVGVTVRKVAEKVK